MVAKILMHITSALLKERTLNLLLSIDWWTDRDRRNMGMHHSIGLTFRRSLEESINMDIHKYIQSAFVPKIL